MSTSNAPVATTFKGVLRQKLKPHNTKIVAVGLLLDAAVGILTLYDSNPPFNPVIYGLISATVKAANLGLHYLSSTIQGEDDAAA